MKSKNTMLACELGIITQAVVNNLLPVLFVIFKERFSVSYTSIANFMLINFSIQLFTDALSAKLIKKLGYLLTGLLAQSSAALGLVLMAFLPKIFPVRISLTLSIAVCSFGGGLLEVMLTPIADSLEDESSNVQMSMLHSFYCWGQVAVILISTICVKLLPDNICLMLPLVWALIPTANIFLFSKVPLPALKDENTEFGAHFLSRSPVFAVLCLLMLCSGAAETAMSQWASLFAQNGLGIGKFFGDIFGPCLFALLMGIGRLLYGIYGGRLSLTNTLLICSFFCTIFYLTSALSQNSYVSLCACALIGLSVSVMWPGVYSYSSKALPLKNGNCFSILALFGDIGCSLGAWMCGAVSDFAKSLQISLSALSFVNISQEEFGLKCGIGSAAVFPIIMLLLIIIMKKKGFRQK